MAKSEKKTILITGASRGIGAATALLAARKGYAVAINYASNADAAQAVVQQINTHGGTALAVQADVADEAQVLAMFAAVDAQFGFSQLAFEVGSKVLLEKVRKTGIAALVKKPLDKRNFRRLVTSLLTDPARQQVATGTR